MSLRAQSVNALPSVVWTVLFVGPLYWFCYRHLELRQIGVFGAIAAIALFLPRLLLSKLALSDNAAAYRRLRVPVVIHLTQDAKWLRHLGGGRQGRARRDVRALRKIESDTWLRERFHLGAFVFYCLCSVHAARRAHPLWCLTLAVANILYNVYPIWVQQFLRLRIARCLQKSRSA